MENGIPWTEHRNFFTANPSLYRGELRDLSWPKGTWSERDFGFKLFGDPETVCALYGSKNDPPRVEHIGWERKGNNY